MHGGLFGSPCSIAERGLSDTQERACLCLLCGVDWLLWPKLRSVGSALGGRRQMSVAVRILSLWEPENLLMIGFLVSFWNLWC